MQLCGRTWASDPEVGEIERPLKRRSLCAPLCSAACGSAASGVQQLPLPWARPEQEVWVLKEVLQPEEVEALLGCTKCKRAYRNVGHLINQFFDPVLSLKLWSRVTDFVPAVRGLAAAGLNEHLRFLRYLSDSRGSDDGTTRFVSPKCPEADSAVDISWEFGSCERCSPPGLGAALLWGVPSSDERCPTSPKAAKQSQGEESLPRTWTESQSGRSFLRKPILVLDEFSHRLGQICRTIGQGFEMRFAPQVGKPQAAAAAA
eukprot:Skav219164  [mRNA]  locus=scaffold648:213569:222097:- [translate_table: standard]